MKVLHCPLIIAKWSPILSRCENQIGVDSTVLSYFRTWGNMEGDINLELDNLAPAQRNMAVKNFFTNNETFLDSFDIIHYHFMDTITYGRSFGGWNAFPEKEPYWELEYFKNKGKKLVFSTAGSDYRNNSKTIYYLATLDGYKGVKPPVGRKDQYEKLNTIAQYADAIIHGDTESTRHLPFSTFITMGIDTTHLAQVKKQYPKKSNQPLIFHAPTNNLLKGSTYVEKLFRRIQTPTFVMNKVPTNQALAFFAETKGIYIDQINFGYGNAFLENLFFGNVAICKFEREEYAENEPKLFINPYTFANMDEFYELVTRPHTYPDCAEQITEIFAAEKSAKKHKELYQLLLDGGTPNTEKGEQWHSEYAQLGTPFAEEYYSNITDFLLLHNEFEKLSFEINNGIGIANDVELYAKYALLQQSQGQKEQAKKIKDQFQSSEFTQHYQRAKSLLLKNPRR